MRPPPLLLGVNIDHCATLRQARYREEFRSCGGMIEPDPVALALEAERSGADGITVHLREDRRHIVDDDVRRLREAIGTRLNLEMACNTAMLGIALDTAPDSVCLVPENREEVTTEGGLDCIGNRDQVRFIVERLQQARIPVSLFIDPDPGAIEAAHSLGVEMVELHTGAFARSWWNPAHTREQTGRLRNAAEAAHAFGLTVNAGHGINYHNIRGIRSLPHLHELNIGHAILSRAMFSGIGDAVRQMKDAMR